MSYKFQRGNAILSGSMIIEDSFEANGIQSLGKVSGSGNLEIGGTVRLDGVADAALDVATDSFYYRDGDKQMKRDTMADYATAIAGAGLAASSGVLAVGVDDTGIEIDSDALRLKDSGVATAKIADNAVTLAKMAGLTRGSIIFGDTSGDPAALAKGTAAQFLQSDGTDVSYVSMSGDATIAAGGALTIADDAVESGMLNDNIISGQTELAHADIVDADELMISDGGVIKRVGIDSLQDHYFGNISGDATVADGGALTIAANAVEGSMINSNAAGDGIAYSSNALQLDLNELTAASVAVASDSIAIIDADDSNKSRKESIADLATGMAGTGLSANAGEFFVDLSELSDVQIAAGDSIAFIDATDSNKSRKDTVDDLATLFAGDGLSASSAVMALDLNELSAAAVDVAADSIAIVDANDSNKSRKESIADLVTAMAGAGLTATSGVLKVTSNNVNLKADSEALVEGYNYFADASSNATVTLPASPSVGDVVVAKAGNLTSGAKILINKGSADHRIDGEESVTIESPFGAITMVYVVADAWRIV
jgi:hypothetical protein